MPDVMYLIIFLKKKVFVTFITLLCGASFYWVFYTIDKHYSVAYGLSLTCFEKEYRVLIMRILWKWENQHNRYALRKYGFLASWNNISHSKGQNWAAQSVSSFLSNLVSSLSFGASIVINSLNYILTGMYFRHRVMYLLKWNPIFLQKLFEYNKFKI